MWRLFIAIFLCFNFADQPAEVAEYDILIGGNKVGGLEASREVRGDVVIFRNTSYTKARFLKNIEVRLEQEAIYKKGVLQEAESKTWVNGNLHKDVEIRKTGKGYTLRSNGKITQMEGAIPYSAIKLMLEEPVGHSRLYSENETEYHRLEPEPGHVYRKVTPAGRENIYRYRNGRLHSAKIDAGWYSFEMKLQ